MDKLQNQKQLKKHNIYTSFDGKTPCQYTNPGQYTKKKTKHTKKIFVKLYPRDQYHWYESTPICFSGEFPTIFRKKKYRS